MKVMYKCHQSHRTMRSLDGKRHSGGWSLLVTNFETRGSFGDKLKKGLPSVGSKISPNLGDILYLGSKDIAQFVKNRGSLGDKIVKLGIIK